MLLKKNQIIPNVTAFFIFQIYPGVLISRVVMEVMNVKTFVSSIFQCLQLYEYLDE